MRYRFSTLIGTSAIAAILVGNAFADRLTPEQVANYDGADRQEVLEACAREEGSVTIYSSLIVDQALRPITEVFAERYDFLDVDFLRETGGGMLQKLVTEARASQAVASVIEATGIDDLAKQAGLIIPFNTPYAAAYPDELKGDDWVASRLSHFGVSYNTNLVQPDELPSTYEDFADSKWSGRLVWSSESTGAPLMITGLRIHYGEEKAYELLQGIAANRIASVSVNQRQVVNQVMAGEYGASLDAFIHHPVISAEAGAPVAAHLAEPVISTNGSVLFPKDGPSPCAGMLLLDFILSTEGQEILREAVYFPTNPDVAPLEMLNPVVPENAGAANVFLSPAVIAEYQARSAEIFQELFR